MGRVLLTGCIAILFFSCKKETPVAKPLVPDSKVSMLVDGVTWESNQAFNGTSATAYNSSVTLADGAKWQTILSAQNNADNYLYLTILYNAKPQVDKEYPFQLVSFKLNNQEYIGGQLPGTSGTLKFTTVTATFVSGTFSGTIALVEGASTVTGYAAVTAGTFTNIRYNP